MKFGYTTEMVTKLVSINDLNKECNDNCLEHEQ